MKDDLIFTLMSGISDEHIKEYEAFEAQQRAALAAEGSGEAAGNASAAVRGRTHRSGRGRAFVRAIATAAIILVFLFGGFLLSKYLNKNRTPEATSVPTDSMTPVTPTPFVTPAPTPDVTSVPEPAITSTPDVTLTAAPTGTPAPTATPALAGTPTATPTVTPEVTATPAATPATTPTATPEVTATATAAPEPYMTGLIDHYYTDYVPPEGSRPDSVIPGTDVTGINNIDNCISGYISNEYFLISGYAYNSNSPLKEVYCCFNDDPAEHYFIGELYPREDIAAAAGFDGTNAQRSGFGGTSLEQFMAMDELWESFEEGIYKIRIMARFEDGSELELCSTRLVAMEPDPAGSEILYMPFLDQPDGLRTEVNVVALCREAGVDYPAAGNYYFRTLYLENSAVNTYDMGNLNLGLFTRCEIEYASFAGWQPQDTATMSEPVFIALSKTGRFPGIGSDGPYKEDLLGLAYCTEETQLVSGHPEVTVTRRAVIDLTDVDYCGHVWFTGFMNPEGPVIVTGIYFYS